MIQNNNSIKDNVQSLQMAVSSRYSPIVVFIGGKKRILKNIEYLTENDLEATYKGHILIINSQETGGYYASVTHPDGCYIIDGYFTEYEYQTIQNVVEMCIENILL
jgi:hypothetical protein